MPAPCAVLAGPLRLTLSRTESVMRAGLLLRRPPAAPRSLSTARAFLLLRRRRFMASGVPGTERGRAVRGRPAAAGGRRAGRAADRREPRPTAGAAPRAQRKAVRATRASARGYIAGGAEHCE